MAGRKKFFDRFSARFESLDATSRQAGLALLMKERGFFETVFNSIEDGIVVVDHELHLRYFNRSAKELLALPENTSTLRMSQLLPDIDWKQIIPDDGGQWCQTSRQELEVLYPEPRFLQFYLTPLTGGEGGAVVILRDVTESRRRAVSDLERETVKAVSHLAAGVAHEIGNPLNCLSMNLQILERGYDDPSEAVMPEDAVRMIRRCQSEVDRLDSIIRSFLTAIRPGKAQFAPVDLRETVFEVLTFMRPEIEARHVSVKCQWESVMPQIPGDAEQLKQAFYNIIRNAVQAMSNGGILEIYGYSAGDFRVLEFSDSGRGMSPEDLREMFVPFKTTKAGGNGIGTMIIERVCREHGAEFGVVSSEGRGTVFQLKFPNGSRRVRMLPGN
ncbi:MAG: PAS domain-containing protein [Lentisphaerae bacterium]|nr:PAS domain-containing protein [Lentisphaerota bacterium]